MRKLAEAGFIVGDNEPYTGALEGDTLYRHGTMRGLPHVLIEMRQDLIADKDKALAFAANLKPLLDAALAEMERKMDDKNLFDEKTRTELEAAVFRHLVDHLRRRSDVQNIDLMIAGGFCRNCLGDWYAEAAAEKGIALDKAEARALVYGMPQAEWKKKYQKEATSEQLAAFAASQKTHT